jgi:hypothetical protein
MCQIHAMQCIHCYGLGNFQILHPRTLILPVVVLIATVIVSKNLLCDV